MRTLSDEGSIPSSSTVKCYTRPGGRIRCQAGNFGWLILVGDDARVAGTVFGPTPPAAEKVREMLHLPPDLPVLVGAP